MIIKRSASSMDAARIVLALKGHKMTVKTAVQTLVDSHNSYSMMAPARTALTLRGEQMTVNLASNYHVMTMKSF